MEQITAGKSAGKHTVPFKKDKGSKPDTKDRGQLVFHDFQVVEQ